MIEPSLFALYSSITFICTSLLGFILTQHMPQWSPQNHSAYYKIE